MARLTTTSYLILGMLTTRDWSAYELAEHVDKGVTEIWPRARRQLYNAPKQLVEQGLIPATKQNTGRRERTVYSITASGRAALQRWLSSDSKPGSGHSAKSRAGRTLRRRASMRRRSGP